MCALRAVCRSTAPAVNSRIWRGDEAAAALPDRSPHAPWDASTRIASGLPTRVANPSGVMFRRFRFARCVCAERPCRASGLRARMAGMRSARPRSIRARHRPDVRFAAEGSR